MRNVPICAIYDNLVGYKNIYIIQNESVAKRAFTNSLISILESGDYGDSSPADLSLYLVGDFDCESGSITPCEPRPIIHGTSIIREWHIDNARRGDCSEVERKGVEHGM